jgi:hypothetical protein
MESQEVLIQKDQNLSQAGYGMSERIPAEATSILQLMAMLYDQPCGFPTYEEVIHCQPGSEVSKRMEAGLIRAVLQGVQRGITGTCHTLPFYTLRADSPRAAVRANLVFGYPMKYGHAHQTYDYLPYDRIFQC